jgi:DNA modification methylase
VVSSGKNQYKKISNSEKINDLHAINYLLWHRDMTEFLSNLGSKPIFDLVVTSPPYNIGKEYEKDMEFAAYIDWQREIIESILPLVTESGSICWCIEQESPVLALLSGKNIFKTFAEIPFRISRAFLRASQVSEP